MIHELPLNFCFHITKHIETYCMVAYSHKIATLQAVSTKQQPKLRKWDLYTCGAIKSFRIPFYHISDYFIATEGWSLLQDMWWIIHYIKLLQTTNWKWTISPFQYCWLSDKYTPGHWTWFICSASKQGHQICDRHMRQQLVLSWF